MLSLTLNDKEIIKISDNIYLKVYKDDYSHYRILIRAPKEIPVKRILVDSDEVRSINFVNEKSIRRKSNKKAD